MKKLTLVLLGCLVGIFLFEGLCWIFLKVSDGSPSEKYDAIYRREANNDESPTMEALNIYKNERMPHPYFGFGIVTGNNYGLPTEVNFPYMAKTKEFVIGIFGGSTARHFANFVSKSGIWSGLKPADKDKAEPVVLNFALPGGKEPQQFIIGSFFLEHIDLAIVIDGWNECVSPLSQPIEYPEGYEVLFPNKRSAEGGSRIYLVQKLWRVFNGYLSQSFFSGSNAIYIIWKNLKTRLMKTVTELRESQASNSFISGGERYQLWKKYFTYFKAIGDLHKVRVLQFLQPNPYIPGSKPLSKEEKETVAFEFLSKSLPVIQEFHSEYLKNRDSRTTDLTFLFKDVREPTYIDAYTHLNEVGYRLMAKAIENRLREERVLQ